jgi:hypothetical protein
MEENIYKMGSVEGPRRGIVTAFSRILNYCYFDIYNPLLILFTYILMKYDLNLIKKYHRIKIYKWAL